jgi:hypothetical protein
LNWCYRATLFGQSKSSVYTTKPNLPQTRQNNQPLRKDTVVLERRAIVIVLWPDLLYNQRLIKIEFFGRGSVDE